MYHKELVKHIQNKKKDWIDKNTINQELRSDGWSEDDIKEAWFYIENPEKQKRFSLSRLLHSEMSVGTFLAVLVLGIVSVTLLTGYVQGLQPAGDNTTIMYANPPKTTFVYGEDAALKNPDFFETTKQKLILEKTLFIEVNLSTMLLRVHKDGEVALEIPVKTKGKEGSWWETPAGLYKIQTKEKSHYSSMGHVTQPWSMQFQGNFFIHGWPKYDDGTPVASAFSGGCIRLTDENAKKVYDLVEIGTPILVYEKDFITDTFGYTEKKPNLQAQTYLFSDLSNNFIFLEQERSAKIPMRGITKLMTALVATEYINIEKPIHVETRMLVPTSNPRLQPGTNTTVYQLLFPLLRESSNEAAEAIAYTYGRSSFIRHMNEKAKAIGMTKTTFRDPTGSTDENTTTPEDIFMLAKYIYNNRSFIFDITSGRVKTSTYGESTFKNLGNASDFMGVTTFFGGITSKDDAYSLGIFKEEIGTMTRPIFFLVTQGEPSKQSILETFNYITKKYK